MQHFFKRRTGYRIGNKRHCIIGVYLDPQAPGGFYCIDDCGRELTKGQARA